MRRFAVATTTDDYQCWAHGFALTATLFAARRALNELVARPGASLSELCARTGANAGHLAVMLRTLSTVGWVSRSADGAYHTSRSVAVCAEADTLRGLCEDVYGEEGGVQAGALSAEAWGRHLPRLARHLASIEKGWLLPAEAADVALLPLMLSGAVIAPLLLELRMMSSSYTAKADAGEHEHASSTVLLGSVGRSVADAVGAFFAFQGWGTYDAAAHALSLRTDGLFIIERCPAFGVCLSYRPMLHQLTEATFGCAASVFSYEGEHEGWVDRKLNVIGSGFMHNRYFADMMSVYIKRIFDETPLTEQPRVVADMGCGDGTLLKTLYVYVRDHTARGRHLEEYPLTMCGVDFNKASEEETARTLREACVPHGTMFGDIGDPVPMQAALEARFGVTRDQVLHVRSFLDHDRPFMPPTRAADPLVEAALNQSDASYVDNRSGALVTPAMAFYSLVEHWERWAACLGAHGLVVLEVSNLDVGSTRRYMSEATSMHFDCVQMHSGQILMPPTHFSLGAASCGLLPSRQTLTYPKGSAYTRIVLQQLRPAGVRVRLATLADLPRLVELEAYWKEADLRADEPTLRRRLTAHPTGQLVVEAADGCVVCAMYTQRVASQEALFGCTRENELLLHVADGPVVQLLGVVQADDAARRVGGGASGSGSGEVRSVGQLLRDYVLHLGRLDATVERACGVTRCRDFDPCRGRSYEEHVRVGDDAGLRFHTDAGASVGRLVHGYRRGDTQNQGIGVLITYELDGRCAVGTGVAGTVVTNSQCSASRIKHPARPAARAMGGAAARVASSQTLSQVEAAVCDAIDALRYGDEKMAWSIERKRMAFMDLGIDSLDATKLVQGLNATFGLQLPNTILFEEPNVRELSEMLLSAISSIRSTSVSVPPLGAPFGGTHLCAVSGTLHNDASEMGEGGVRRFAVATTTDDYQCWAHGFALTATLFAARRALNELVARPGASLSELCARTGANAGHLAVMLRTLSTVGWVSRSADGAYHTSRSVAVCAEADTLRGLCEDVYGEEGGVQAGALSAEAWGRHLPRLARHLASIEKGWLLPAEAADVALLPLMLSGAVIAPLLLELRMMSSSYTAKADAGEHEHASSTVLLGSVGRSVADAVGAFFAFQGWGTYDAAAHALSLRTDGLFIIERCPAFGVCLSYRPMLHQLTEATFGCAASVFSYEGEHEGWVDRKLNVIGSGFMHNRYFADMMSVYIKRIFDETPLTEQPRVVADMGCGDGTLLKTLYVYVRDHTARGRHLEEYPLTMCGVDFNKASEEETARTLREACVPHGTMFGDIGDPVPMQAALEARFGVTRDQVLHVRSFLDHDRPFMPPTRAADPLVEAALNQSDASYVDNRSGALVTPAMAFYSLVEHWERWAACLGAHGLVVLEVSNLDVGSTRRYMSEATSMHFDCVQMHSGQILMPPTHFSLGAASCGLLPSRQTLTYPKGSAYTRIVLQQLRPAGVRVRLATLADLPRLVELEAYWKEADLRADEPTLRRRLTAHPTGQLVVEAADGCVVCAMYTQRVASQEALFGCTRENELLLHVADGPVVQLLGVVQADDAARRVGGGASGSGSGEVRSVGQLLRDYVLHLGRLDATVERACGVTRCRDFDPCRGRSYEEHVRVGDDAGLRFHTDAGASVGRLVHGYRRGDTQNQGIGVLITYELDGRCAVGTGVAGTVVTNSQCSASRIKHPARPAARAMGGAAARVASSQTLSQVEAAVCDAIDALRYGDEKMAWSIERKRMAFMDLGIDSLDATKLVQGLNATFGLQLPNTILFEEPNVRELSGMLFRCLDGGSSSPLQGFNVTPHTDASGGTLAGFVMAPPSNDAFYLRHQCIPHYMVESVAANKLGVPHELSALWAAQRQATAVVTKAMLDEAMRIFEVECSF